MINCHIIQCAPVLTGTSRTCRQCVGMSLDLAKETLMLLRQARLSTHS